MIDFRWLSVLCDVLHWQFANPGSEDGPQVPMAGRRLWEIPACDAEVGDCDAEDDDPNCSPSAPMISAHVGNLDTTTPEERRLIVDLAK